MSPTTELLDLAIAIADRAGAGEQIEAFLTHERTFEVRAFEGEVESLSSAEPRGAGVRVVEGGRVGFAFTTDLSDTGLGDVVERARGNARFATQDDASVLPEVTSPAAAIAGLLDERQTSVDPETKVAFALELERATRTHDRRIKVVEDAVYSDSHSDIAIASSTGVSGAYSRTDAWCYSVAIVEDSDDTQVGFDFDLGRGLHSLDAEDVARRGVERALRVLGGRKIPSRRMPIVLDPYTAAQFLGVLGGVLTGEAVQKKRSLFAGRLGDKVGVEELTIVDDGRLEGAPAAAPWDAEGVPTQRTEVVAKGYVRQFLYDTKSARREGRASTGNASRAGYRSLPHAAPSNMALEATGESRAQLLERSGRAFYVQDFHGVHSGANPVTGDFSVGASGVLLDGGEAAQPVKEVTIAAPMLEILAGISAVASDRRWMPFEGAYAGATTLIAEMTIAGE